MSDTVTTAENQAAEQDTAPEPFAPDLSPEAVGDFVANLGVSQKVVDVFTNLASTLVNFGSAERCRKALYELRTGVNEVKVQGPSGAEASVWEPVYDPMAAQAVTILQRITESAGSEQDLDPENEDGLAGQINALRSTVKVLDLPEELTFACDVMLDAVTFTMTTTKPRGSVTQLKTAGQSRGQIPEKITKVLSSHPGQRFSLSDLNKLIPEHGTGALGAALNRMVASGQARAMQGTSSSGREAILYSAA